ncbi:SDR family oxidoreductase [Methylobacterium sp. W2]|uniref:NAD-dependent epimerase/dehydratase family protein n=1 Tax=Methylobacterium sp. W2 TaxID=2598107 RepID=UPI001D0CC33A|nr:SDR family oxidoreductase [Methylobacterium sp. W2]MCC0804941.1 SDR family oxidoreductase [Methylobacterium sp. W2]
MNAKIAVTGAGGYIGSVMVGELLRNGYRVKAIDAFYFGTPCLSKYDGHPKLEIVKQDIRTIDHRAYHDCDYAIDLAALSNDPSGDLDPELTRSINEKGRVRAAMAAKRAGVRRYLFASSCAVYGAGQDMFLAEDTPLRPLTIYAQTCARAEEAVLALNTGHFTATALRNATVFGLSPRMRFDLVVNQMTFDALDRGRITVGGDGSQWRPVVHVRDVAAAFLGALRAPSGAVAGEAFNIGWDNRQIVDIALAVKNTVSKPIEIEFMPGGLDRRDYHVSFAKAREDFGFSAKHRIEDAVIEIQNAIEAKILRNTPACNTVKWYKMLLADPLQGLSLPLAAEETVAASPNVFPRPQFENAADVARA